MAALILGLVWTFWHLSAFFAPGSAQEGVSFPPPYIVNTMVLTMIITVIHLRMRRFSRALYFHTSANFALGIFYIIDEPLGRLFIGIRMLTVFGILLYLEGSRMFHREPEVMCESRKRGNLESAMEQGYDPWRFPLRNAE